MGQNKIPNNCLMVLDAFKNANEVDERALFLDKKSKLQELFDALFAIVDAINNEPDLVYYCLCLINGILED